MASIEQHQQLREALERYSKKELVDLMEHLLKVYVLNEPVKLDTAVQKPESIREFAGYTFSQLLTWLQNNLEMEELDHFRVTPYTVMVSVGEAEFDLNGPTPTLASSGQNSGSENEEDDGLTAAQRMDASLENKPWRRNPEPAAPRVSHAETPSMADLFAGDSPSRGFAFFDEAPGKAEDPDEPPPIAEVAPGDDPNVTSEPASSTDFAKAAASREDAPAAQEPATPPPLAEGDTQINPSNRFASLDLD